MTQRTEQVSTTLQRAIQKVLSKGLADPRVKGLITVTRVDVAPDLTQATMFCSVTPHKYSKISMKGIESAATWIRRQVSDNVRFRKMPAFTFKLDEQLLKQQEVLSSIAEAREEDERRAKSNNQRTEE